jgi:hypothetical protein
MVRTPSATLTAPEVTMTPPATLVAIPAALVASIDRHASLIADLARD